MQITPLIALCIDVLATLISQAALVIMKLSHISSDQLKLDDNFTTCQKIRASGFFRWKWAIGLLVLIFGSLTHACKYISILIAF